jgi:hypothetical protein
MTLDVSSDSAYCITTPHTNAANSIRNSEKTFAIMLHTVDQEDSSFGSPAPLRRSHVQPKDPIRSRMITAMGFDKLANATKSFNFTSEAFSTLSLEFSPTVAPSSKVQLEPIALAPTIAGRWGVQRTKSTEQVLPSSKSQPTNFM